jgi:hypothetical protein
MVALAGASWATPTFAADPPPAAAPSADAPPPAAPPPAAPPPADAKPADAPAPATNTESMPATKPETLPPIGVGAWLRAGSIFQKAGDPKSLGDWHMDTAYVELHAGGKIHKNVGVTLNLASNMNSLFNPPGNGTGEGGAYVAVEDAIISFDFMDELHLWGGHLLVPVDRSNASGPFFMIPWNYPGFFAGVAAPQEGPLGRNNGAVVWGDIQGGKFSYFAGAFDNASVSQSPLFSGRFRIALLDPEPGFWGNGSYFGDKDLFTINVGAQFQKNGSTTAAGAKDWTDINADVLYEKKLGGGSFVTGEAGYYHYGVNDGAISDMLYVLGAFATSPIGVGNLQPHARFQWEKVKGPSAPKPWNLDVGLAYLVKGPGLRALATFSHTDFDLPSGGTGPDSANSLQLGAQAIFF